MLCCIALWRDPGRILPPHLPHPTITVTICHPRNVTMADTAHTQFIAVLQSKLSSLSRLEERLDLKLGLAAELPGRLEGLAQQQAAESAGLETLRKDVKVRAPKSTIYCGCTRGVTTVGFSPQQ